MKKIFDYCTQKGAYKSSEGLALIEIEDGDNSGAIIAEYTKKREWYEKRYYLSAVLKEYTYKDWKGDSITIKGNLVLFKTYQEYLD